MLPKKLKILFILAGIFFLFTLVYLPGFTKYQDLKRREVDLTNEIDRLKNVTDHLTREEDLLSGDQDYLEKVARENLGRVRPGEVVYKVVPMQEKKKLVESAQENTASPATSSASAPSR